MRRFEARHLQALTMAVEEARQQRTPAVFSGDRAEVDLLTEAIEHVRELFHGGLLFALPEKGLTRPRSS